VFRDGEIDERLALPLEVEQVTVAAVAHDPSLGLGHDRLAVGVKQVINGGPFYFGAVRDHGRAGDAAPVVFVGIREIVATVDARQTPVDTGLMLVVAGTVFREHAFAIGRNDGVQVGAKIGTGVLREDRRGDAVAEDRERLRGGVLTERERAGRDARNGSNEGEE